MEKIAEQVNGVIATVRVERRKNGLGNLAPDEEKRLRRYFEHYFRREHTLARIVEALKVTYMEACVIAKKLGKNGINLQLANV
jgi:DNA-directed RNA polymerase sigma subunit (sigma70/sigma32)